MKNDDIFKGGLYLKYNSMKGGRARGCLNRQGVKMYEQKSYKLDGEVTKCGSETLLAYSILFYI